MPWVGVDFDGTLVTNAYPGVGQPVRPMVEFVRQMILSNVDVRIFTNRADREEDCVPVRDFCHHQFGKALPIAREKDRDCVGIYDDIAFHVERDQGWVCRRSVARVEEVHQLRAIARRHAEDEAAVFLNTLADRLEARL